MGGSSKSQVVGYKYYLGMHQALCHGPIDKITRIRVDKRDAWLGENTGGTISINEPELFGGEKREGGIVGDVDIEMGGPAQGQNDYLLSKLGSGIPAFRGVVGAVLRQVYLGVNPYLKAWDFRCQRIHTRQDGQAQWYDAKAEVNAQPINYSTRWERTQDSPYVFTTPGDELTWDTDPNNHTTVVESGGKTMWPSGNSGDTGLVWLFFDLPDGVPYSASFDVKINYDDSGKLLATSGPGINVTGSTAPAPLRGYPREEGYKITIDKTDQPFSGWVCFACVDARDIETGDRLGSRLQHKVYIHDVTQIFDQRDMNPAHIIRECLTDPDWGMGYPETDIDDAAFTAAADTLYAEGMGISLLWDRATQIEDFITEILRHIDAVLYVEPTTGLFTLKLIRADYDPATLPLFDESNVERVERFKRPSLGELVNQITVTYWDWITSEDASITATNLALQQLQGATIAESVQYPGFTNRTNAMRALQRDLRNRSTPLASATIKANRDAASLRVGDVFRLTWPDHDVSNLVMRVLKIDYGDATNGLVTIEAIEDNFDLPAAVDFGQDSLWEDSTSAPAASPVRLAAEAPYYELVQRLGQSDADQMLTDNPASGYLVAAGSRPSADAINATLLTDSGAGYQDYLPPVPFMPTAELAADVGYTDTTWAITGGVDLDLVQTGTHMQIGEELCRVDAISDTSITVGRGVLDTVPAPHAAGTVLKFWDEYSGTDGQEYVDGETVNVKLLPTTGNGTLSEPDTPADALTFASRAIRPYPPGNVQINGIYFPSAIIGSLSVQWSHRDRQQQTGGALLDFQSGDIGPETGTTYDLSVYGDGDALLDHATGLTGTMYTLPSEGSHHSQYRVTLKSVRDGYESHQSYNYAFDRAGYGFHYGKYYGGI